MMLTNITKILNLVFHCSTKSYLSSDDNCAYFLSSITYEVLIITFHFNSEIVLIISSFYLKTFSGNNYNKINVNNFNEIENK